MLIYTFIQLFVAVYFKCISSLYYNLHKNMIAYHLACKEGIEGEDDVARESWEDESAAGGGDKGNCRLESMLYFIIDYIDTLKEYIFNWFGWVKRANIKRKFMMVSFCKLLPFLGSIFSPFKYLNQTHLLNKMTGRYSSPLSFETGIFYKLAA